MNKLIEIYYDRNISSSEVTLTPENCASYGYVQTSETIDGVTYTCYYLATDTSRTIVDYSVSEGVATTVVTIYQTQRYTHIAPECSKYTINFADVDKEGSGRNELTGEMYRERIGRYCSIDIAWDLIPDTVEYNNWYKILTHLPEFFYGVVLLPSGEIETKKFYRGDVSTDLYWFVGQNQLWQGLSTTFVQWDVEEYDDTSEPTLTVIATLTKNGETKYVYSNTEKQYYISDGWVET